MHSNIQMHNQFRSTYRSSSKVYTVDKPFWKKTPLTFSIATLTLQWIMNYTTVLCHQVFASVYISLALSLELQKDFS